jgi:dTDP-4-dehydrorhamnose 3,5-epimerase
MKITSVTALAIPDVKIIGFERFRDVRGFFTETYRRSDFLGEKKLGLLHAATFVQCNESFSRRGTIRGLHFQWNPYMGKLVRTIQGRMIDLFLDIRKGSPTFGCLAAYDMPADPEGSTGLWIWVPPGFAHGNLFLENTIIEYFCTGEYSQGCEACISPLASDINWSLCDTGLKRIFDGVVQSSTVIITDKDRNGLSVAQWLEKPEADNFLYSLLAE